MLVSSCVREFSPPFLRGLSPPLTVCLKNLRFLDRMKSRTLFGWFSRQLTLYGKLPYIYIMKESKSQTARLEARLPAHVHAMLKRAAEIQGRTLTDFVVAASSEAARLTIETTDIIRLSVDDQRFFAESILNPPEPTAALRQAFEKHRELFGVE